MSRQLLYRMVVIALVLGLSPGLLLAQEEKQPRPPGQYKRIHQRLFRQILRGKPAAALEELRTFLARYPNDAESWYMLTVALTALGRHEEALASMQKALNLGMPVGRFLGGTRTGLEPLRQLPAFQKVLAAERHEPVHGPMLGDVTGTSVKVWVRTAQESKVEVVVAESEKFDKPMVSRPVQATKQTDFTAVVPVEGLKPLTRYHYRVRIDGKDAGKTHTFRTFPEVGKPGKFRLGFGGGAGYVPDNERAWNTIRAQKPDAFFLLGDNVYIDDPKTPAMQHYCYYRRQSRPEFRALTATTPIYSIWDDHDFGTNDCSGGPKIDTPAWKRPVYQVFRNNWVNPGYGGGDEQPGCYYDFYLADVHFLMLDGRYYRNHKAEDRGQPTMLGPVQRDWLLKKLQNTKGRLVVLCSPVPWVFKAKGTSKDTWNGFQKERNEIFNFLAKHKIEGVVLLSADRHRSDLWKIEREQGYPLFEFNSSRLTNQARHGTMKQALFSYNKKQSFGLVDFDTTVPDPTVTYRVMTIDGEEMHAFTIKRSQLSQR